MSETTNSTTNTITFIGAGNMSRSLIAGLSGEQDLTIRVSDPDESQLEGIQKNWTNIESFTDNVKAIDGVDVVVLAVKPQLMQTVCEPLQSVVKIQKPLIISIAAGVSIDNLAQWFTSDELSIVRCMPNTPALVQSGMTGLFANQHVSENRRNLAESILRSVGSTLWLSTEDKLDAVTAVSGSGPAYYFLVMEAMQNSAVKLGLSADEARLLVLQTALGAAKLALESNDDASVLRQRVTSKGGTTEAALRELMNGGLPELFEVALKAAAERSVELRK